MTDSTTRDRIGWMLVLLVVLGTLAPQVLGTPYITDHSYNFRWSYGFPCVFVQRYGLKPSPATVHLKDRTDSHWTTRVLVPILSGRDRYPARTSVLPTNGTLMYGFRWSGLLVNCGYGIAFVAAALHVKQRMARATAVPRSVILLMVISVAASVMYSLLIIMTWERHVCLITYHPPIIAMNVLGVGLFFLCIFDLLKRAIKGARVRRRKPEKGRGQLNGGN